MKTYSEKLKDPRWQKRRLQILQNDEWTCRHCGSKTKTLNVHHTHYARGKDPWEYGDEDLMTLCEGCHSVVTELTTAYARCASVFPDFLKNLREVFNSPFRDDLLELVFRLNRAPEITAALLKEATLLTPEVVPIPGTSISEKDRPADTDKAKAMFEEMRMSLESTP